MDDCVMEYRTCNGSNCQENKDGFPGFFTPGPVFGHIGLVTLFRRGDTAIVTWRRKGGIPGIFLPYGTGYDFCRLFRILTFRLLMISDRFQLYSFGSVVL